MSSNYQFFDYHRYIEKKIQFKRAIISQISEEKFFFVPIRYKNQEIYVRTPKIVVPFGLNIYTTENNEIYYYCAISFTDMDIDLNIEKFYQFLQKIEKFCQSEVRKNLIKWGCNHSFDQLSFKSGFKESGGIPLFRLKVTHTGKQLTELYDEKGNPLEISRIEEYVTEQCQIINLLELQNIWINSTEYGITWKIRQMRVYPSTRPIGGVSLLDENINLHMCKIVEHVDANIDNISVHGIPEAPPLAPQLEPSTLTNNFKRPPGGLMLLPFLSSIKEGGFGLKKIDHNETNKGKFPKSEFPEISLKEILNIRQKLKKTSMEVKKN